MNYEMYCESAAVLRERLQGFQPEVLLILGSGLGFLADTVPDAITVPYGEVPHMRQSTAIGHAGRFVAGTLAGRRVLMMQGRLHVYEGYTAAEAAYPVRVARLLGCTRMIVTNAAGGINTGFHVGDLMVITDFIRLAGPNALMGPNIEEFGPRFPDMSHVFDRAYIAALHEAAAELGEPLRSGVYYYTTGPQYETPAEIRAMRTLGADAVGMSTVHEAITAAHAGMRTLGISLITNMAAGVLDKPLSGEAVIAEGERAKGKFSRLILAFLERMD